MNIAATTTPGRWLLAVGDGRRPRIGRAIVGSLLAAGTFEVFAFGAKEASALSSHSPWADDPYDAVVSFAIFFVPLVAGLSLVRLVLCRRDEPLPIQRVDGLLRGARLMLGTVAVTLLSDWTAVGFRVNSESWSGTTVLLVMSLAVVTAVTAWASAAVLRGAGARLRGPTTPATGPDWLADLITVADRGSVRLGPLRPPADAALMALDRTVVHAIRAHPLSAAAALALAFGIAIALAAAAEEGASPVLLLFVGVGAAGMFAFLAAGGSYLRLVARERPLRPRQRRVTDAAVLAAASVPIALAFRDALWPLIGATTSTAGVSELEILLVVMAVATFAAVLAIESGARLHSD